MKRLKTGSIRRAMFVGIMSIVFILSIGKSVYAEETGQGMISVALKDLSKLEGSISTYSNVEFSLYRVGTTDENGKSAMNEEYGITAFPVTAAEYDAAAKSLKDKVKDSALVEKKTTDANGRLLFNGLPDGVYLLIATSASNYGIVQPALIHLPYYVDIQESVTYGQMVREIEVEPKAETVIPVKPGGGSDTTDTTDTTKPDTTKPDTTKPDTTKPDTTKPDTTKPDTTDSTEKDTTNKPESYDGGDAPGPDSTGNDKNPTSPSASTSTSTHSSGGTTPNKVTTTTSNRTDTEKTTSTTGKTGSPGTTPGKSTATTSTSRVKTGDETPIAVYLALAGISLLVLGMVIKTRRERKTKIETEMDEKTN